MAKTTPPKSKTDSLSQFKLWAAGRTGLTLTELIDVFATSFNLTPAEKKTLTEQLKSKAPKTPTYVLRFPLYFRHHGHGSGAALAQRTLMPNREELNPQTEGGRSFAAWVADRRTGNDKEAI